MALKSGLPPLSPIPPPLPISIWRTHGLWKLSHFGQSVQDRGGRPDSRQLSADAATAPSQRNNISIIVVENCHIFMEKKPQSQLVIIVDTIVKESFLL